MDPTAAAAATLVSRGPFLIVIAGAGRSRRHTNTLEATCLRTKCSRKCFNRTVDGGAAAARPDIGVASVRARSWPPTRTTRIYRREDVGRQKRAYHYVCPVRRPSWLSLLHASRQFGRRRQRAVLVVCGRRRPSARARAGVASAFVRLDGDDDDGQARRCRRQICAPDCSF
jgi:hypothetical protein